MNFLNYFLGNRNSSINKINFEDIQRFLVDKSNKLLINTLDISKQDCLIKFSTKAEEEESIIRNLIDKQNFAYCIFIYGENSNDKSIYKKYEQLSNLGFSNIFIYIGGLFEWLCLQDIYGIENFPTTLKELDILKYRPKSDINNYLLTLD